MSLFQAILIGILSMCAASTIACLGTTVGNYTMNRPLVAGLLVGIVMGDVSGVIGITLFYGTAMMNLIWQHWGWAQLEKGNIDCLGTVDVILPLISHFVLSFLPCTLLCYFGAGAVEQVFQNLNTDVWYIKAILTVGSLLPAVGIAILLKSVVSKMTDLIYFLFGFALAASMGLTLLAATAVGAAFALVNYQLTMAKANGGSGGSDDFDDEEDI